MEILIVAVKSINLATHDLSPYEMRCDWEFYGIFSSVVSICFRLIVSWTKLEKNVKRTHK